MASSPDKPEAATRRLSREHWFLIWVGLALTAAFVVGNLPIFGKTFTQVKLHHYVANHFGAEVDWLLVGDSKAGRFSYDGLVPFNSRRGLVFTSDSVTPVYQYHVLRQLKEKAPNFKPKVVFISTGANNFNRNGLHCRRDLALYTMLDLPAVAALTLPNGATLDFVEAVTSRLFPVYGKRVLITHFNFALGDKAKLKTDHIDWVNYTDPRQAPPETRDPIKDRNYLEIYRRSVLVNFEYSRVVEAALTRLVAEVRELGAEPVLVFLPVTEEMRALERELVGDAFDAPMQAFAKANSVTILDLREQHHYEFEDVNHLTHVGALTVAEEHFVPRVNAAVGTTAAEDSSL